MRKLLCFLFCLSIVCLSPLNAHQSSPKDVVLANEKKFSEFQIQGKCDEAARLLDSKYRGISVGIGTKSDGLGCQPHEHFTGETFSNIDFTLLTSETALVTYKEDGSFLDKNVGTISLQAYVASVWVKRGSEWLLGLHTGTSIPFAVTEQGKLRLLYADPDEGHDESSGQTGIEDQIISLETRLWNGDSNEISKLEAEDYEVIKHARRYNRADDEAAAKEANFSLVSMDDVHVRMLRPDVALLTYHANQKGSFRGINVPQSLYFGSIWVKQGEDWKNVFLEENLPDAFTETYLPLSAATNGSVARKLAGENGSSRLPNESDEIKAMVVKYAKSIDEADTMLASQVWVNSPDVSFIHPLGHEHGFDQIKGNVYRHLMGDTFSERKLSPRDIAVHIYGNSACVEFYWDFVAKLRKDGSTITTHGRETQLYSKMPDGWRLVHVHISGMPVAENKSGF